MTTTIIDAMIDRLTETMQTPFEETDATRLNYVGVGKLQDNYNRFGVSILIRPSTEAEQHQLNTDSNFKTPISLIGGGGTTLFYRRRFTLEINMFFTGADDDPLKDGFRESSEKANILLARLRHAIMTIDYGLGRDDYGESVVMPPVVTREFLEEGGSKRGQNNYRGDVIVDWFTMFAPI